MLKTKKILALILNHSLHHQLHRSPFVDNFFCISVHSKVRKPRILNSYDRKK